jgi:dihydrodipicolinate synthase/N-acetylneuraminate lyase
LDRDTLDIAGLKRLIDGLIDGEVNGLFILGTTGAEAPARLGAVGLFPLRGE